MKIGILTFHRAENYGALMQSIALRETLQKLGHEAYFIDYWPDEHKNAYSIINPDILREASILGKIKHLVVSFLMFFPKLYLKRIFKTFLQKHINPHCVEYSKNTNLEAVIYGSDQIWRAFFKNRIDPVYLGENIFSNVKKISYAASCGSGKIEKDVLQVVKSLEKFSAISVREQDLEKFLTELGLKNVTTCLDPTLLLSKSEWDKILPPQKIPQKDYVLYYALQSDSFSMEEVHKFTKLMNCELITINGSLNPKFKLPNHKIACPQEFIDLVRGAKFVLTSSFHGLVFSIIFQKPFFASMKNYSTRAENLLESLNLLEFLLPPNSKIPTQKPIDWEKVEEKLHAQRQLAEDFLRNSL